MVIFHSYVSLPEGIVFETDLADLKWLVEVPPIFETGFITCLDHRAVVFVFFLFITENFPLEPPGAQSQLLLTAKMHFPAEFLVVPRQFSLGKPFGPGMFWWVFVLKDYSYTSARTNYYAGHRCPFPIGSVVNWRTLWDERPIEEAISIGNWIVATKQGVSAANMEDIKPYWTLPKMKYHFLNHLEASVSHCFFIYVHVFLQNPTLAAGRTSSLTLLTRIAGRNHRNLGVGSIPLCRKAGGTQGMAGWFMSSESFQTWIKNHHLFRGV